MIFTPEERRALLALGAVLVFGQALSWMEDWKEHAPDRELAAWLAQVREVRAAADSAATSAPGILPAPVDPPPPGEVPPVGTRISPAPGEEGPPGPGSAASGPAPGPAVIAEGALTELPPGLLETGRIRIDLATAEELTALPGIGPSLAARIVAAREEAPFRAVDDLLRVKGIGPKTLDRLRDHVSVESPPATADSSRGEQHVDAAESRRRSEARPGGPHQ